MRLPKVEKIKKENKTIDDLLKWNKEVTDLISNVNNAVDVELICEDFKIFNPMNEKLVSNESFPRINKLKAGLFDDEKFTRYMSP